MTRDPTEAVVDAALQRGWLTPGVVDEARRAAQATGQPLLHLLRAHLDPEREAALARVHQVAAGAAARPLDGPTRTGALPEPPPVDAAPGWEAETVEGPAPADDAPRPSSAPARSAFGAAEAWRPGERVGEHEVERVLGRGGMGVVYLARHVPTGEPRALKTLRHDAEPRLLARFRREGQAQARVDRHPHVVRVHSAGDAGGRAYLVLELVTGGDLDQRLRAGPLAPREAARVVADVGRGLAHAHRHGVLHRDLKPANVMFDERGTPKLVDFGLARVAGEQGTVLTRTGEALGTPSYMAPEQIDGAREADARSDVYGLGGLLFVTLTGRPPFSAASAPELFRQVFFEPAPAPSSVRADVPPALDAICARALAKDPAERFPSADAMVEALDAFLAGRAAGTRRRRPLLVAAALVLVAGAAAALVVRARGRTGEAPAPVTTTGAPGPATDTTAPRPAPAPSWRLERGDELTVEFTWEETNEKPVHLTVRGVMRLRVEARTEGRARLSSTLELSHLRAVGSDGDLAGIAVEREVLERARDRREFTCTLALTTGRVSRPEGLDALREELRALVQPTVFDLPGEEYQGQRMLRLIYDAASVGRLLDTLFGLLDPDAGWTLQRGVHRLRLEPRPVPALPLVINDPDDRVRFGATGEAEFSDGRLVKTRVEQEGRLDAASRCTSSFTATITGP